MAPEHRRSAVRRLAFVTAAAVVSAAALTPGPAFPARAASHLDPPPPAPVTQSAPPAEPPEGRIARQPAFGAYLDYGPAGPERMKELGRWLGGHEPRVGHTYLPGDLWRNIEGGHDFLDSWAKWRQDRADRMLVLNVPMMERNEENVPDADVRQLLRRAADGEFDDHFEVLAERLVELGAEDTVIVLGWEMNGVTYTHRCAPDPERWKRYFRRIVTVMRSVPGEDFRFDFAPSRGRDAIPWTQCYPGDDYVDIVGMDAYDQPRGLTFDQQVSEPYGLQHHVEFARAHDKPISYPEWGLFRNGDNITWMLRMLAWMDEHKPLYNTITDYCPHGVWLCSDNPRASALYRLLLSSPFVPQPHPQPEPGPSVPVPTAPTTPAEPDPTADPTADPDGPATPTPMPSKLPYCAPLDLAKWFEQQVGGKLTVCVQWSER
ncbi:glycosyl hydrolase [Streptomyces sp. R28]|uniref:Glycosyl hydrolase n=1 Tax=Streptomyces sp. R28 TaxID=3238628 RepID=A0AB39PWY0_9ACTN